MRTADPEAIVGAYVDAFNAENLEALVATLSADIEIASRRGPVVGRDAARRWARRHVSGGLRQRLVLDGVRARLRSCGGSGCGSRTARSRTRRSSRWS
jgi:hypothetical protein